MYRANMDSSGTGWVKQHTGHGEKAEVRYGHRYLTEWSEMMNALKKESENWSADL